jgi:hypothetical protein
MEELWDDLRGIHEKMNHSQGRGRYMCDKKKREQEKDTGNRFQNVQSRLSG